MIYIIHHCSGWLRRQCCGYEDLVAAQVDGHQVQQAGREPDALRGPAGRADPARAAHPGGGPRCPGRGQQVSVVFERKCCVTHHTN